MLRVVRRRWLAAWSGACLLAAAVVVWAGEFAWETWLTDGGGLIAGATGLALLAVGLGGHRPDWIDPDQTDSAGRR